MSHRGSFKVDINKKCILYKIAGDGFKYVFNEHEKLKIESENVLKDLNIINNNKI